MSLIKTGFWLTLAVLLLPTDAEQQARVYAKAAGAVQWAVTFCDRNGATCDSAAVHWQTLKQKADFGVRLAGDIVRQQAATPAQHPADKTTGRLPAGYGDLQTGTLAARDMDASWRGQPRR